MNRIVDYIGTLVAITVFLMSVTGAVADPLVMSSFDNGAEGWSVADFDQDFWTNVTNFEVSWSGMGGNPDGFISETAPRPRAYTFSAPEKFRGHSSLYARS